MRRGLLLLALSVLSACSSRDLRRLAPPPADSSDPIETRFRRSADFESENKSAEAVMELRAIEAETADNDPRRPRVYERLGMIYLAEHDWAPAHEAFVKALKSAADRGQSGALVADSYAGIGLVLAGQRRFYRAAQYLRKGLDLGPDPDVKARAEEALAAVEPRVKEDPELEDFGPAFVVMKIDIEARWTENSIIRERIPFQEGDTISARELDQVRANLYRMNMFKAVDVSTSALEGGARVTVKVKDGWYVIPLPMIAAGAGSGRGGVIIEERNVFSRAEGSNLLILRGQSGRRTAFGAGWEGWSFSYSATSLQYGENIYADGGYSAIEGLGTPLDASDPAHFGAIADSYGKRVLDNVVAVDGPAWRGLRGEFGFDQSFVGYTNPGPVAPADTGRQGNLFGAVSYGAPDRMQTGLGEILGFGLAGEEELLKPLIRPRWSTSGELRGIAAGRATKSSFGYDKLLAHVQESYTWGDHESVSLAVGGGHGETLPDRQLMATGHQTALEGTYAREFRGPSAAGASLSYARPVVASRWGFMQAGLFIEDARAWFHHVSADKQGMGATVLFRFRRFPLPMGVSYTYSIDDRQGLVSGAVGGRF